MYSQEATPLPVSLSEMSISKSAVFHAPEAGLLNVTDGGSQSIPNVRVIIVAILLTLSEDRIET